MSRVGGVNHANFVPRDRSLGRDHSRPVEETNIRDVGSSTGLARGYRLTMYVYGSFSSISATPAITLWQLRLRSTKAVSLSWKPSDLDEVIRDNRPRSPGTASTQVLSTQRFWFYCTYYQEPLGNGFLIILL